MKRSITTYSWKKALVASLLFFSMINLSAQTISTIAGNGTSTSNGDGGAATMAGINNPASVALDANGNIYIADYSGSRIRKINTSGIISTIAGTGTPGFSGDGSLAVNAQVKNPSTIVLDASGNIFFTDDGNLRIRKINTSGIISTVAGSGTSAYYSDGTVATSAGLNTPQGLAVDATGNIFFSDGVANRVLKVGTNGLIYRYAGDPNNGNSYRGDGGQAVNASLSNPAGLAVDAAGNLFIADFYNNCIRKVSASTKIISTVAGNATFGDSGDGGIATNAQLTYPRAIAFDVSGNMYIVDRGNNKIKKVSTSGIITTIIGTTSGFGGDGGLAINAQLSNPTAITIDALGNQYVADASNNRIRKVTLPVPPTITTISPTTAAVGTLVTITGANILDASAVKFGGVAATTFTLVNATTLTAVVPDGAISGTVGVTAGGGTVSKSGFVVASIPVISSFSPANGCQGTSVSITGSNFIGTTAVSFGGINAASFTVNSSTSITAVIGGIVTGSVKVTNASGTGFSNSNITAGSVINTLAYIPNKGSGNVSVVNCNNGTVVQTIPVGTSPNAVAISPDGTKVYVTNQSSNNVSVISTATNTVIATIAIGTPVGSLCISPDGNTLYVASYNNNPGSISIINTLTNTVSSTISVGYFINSMCISPDGSRVYVSYSNVIAVISTAINTIVATINSNTVLGYASAMVVSPNGTTLYVNNPNYSSVVVVNAITNTITTSIPVNGYSYGICINPDGSKLYLTRYNPSNSLAVINTATNTIVSQTALSTNPYGISISPDGSNLLVTYNTSNSLSVVNVSTYTVTSTINVGTNPIVSGNFALNTVTNCPPAITSTSPTSGAVGATIKIYGSGFTGATAISFGGVSTSTFTVDSATGITAVVPVGATSGNVSVTTANGTGSLAGFVLAVPTITSISPSSIISGGTVTISGAFLSGATSVSFGGVSATSFSVINSTTISAVLGLGASGNVNITTPIGTATFSGFIFNGNVAISNFTPQAYVSAGGMSNGGSMVFSYSIGQVFNTTIVSGNAMLSQGIQQNSTTQILPVVKSFSPTSTYRGQTVTIRGTGLTGTSIVTFGGDTATSTRVINDSTITAVVGNIGATGSVNVITCGGNSSLAGFTFIPPPSITSFSPTSAKEGATVTITGTGFLGTTSVSFGDTAASSFTVVNATTITAVISSGGSGFVKVTTNGTAGSGGTDSLSGFKFLYSPTIGALSISSYTYGASPFSLAAPTSNSAGTFTYTSSNTAVATISGSTVTMVGAGTSVITATQAAYGNYATGSVSANLVVNQKAPTIGTMTIPTTTFGAAPFTISPPVSNSGCPVTYTSSNPSVASVSSSGLVTILGAGAATITATQASCGNYTSGTTTAPITVNPATPTLGTMTVPNTTYGSGSFTLTPPTSNSGCPITYTSSNPSVASVSSAGLVTVLSSGSATITATQAACGNYTGATTTAPINVNPATPNLGTLYVPTTTYGSGPITITPPTSNSTCPITYSSSNTSVATVNSSGVVTIIGAGTTTITATQAACGNYTTASKTTTLTVNPATPSLGNISAPTSTFGSAPFSIAPPTSNSICPITYNSSNTGVATINGSGQVTIIGAGTTTITATQAACGNYASATTTTILTINPLAASLGTFTVGSVSYGNAPFVLTPPSSNSNGVFTYSSSNTNVATISGNVVTVVGVGSTTITANQAATQNYSAAYTSTVFTVTGRTPTIGSFSVATPVNFGSADQTLIPPISNSVGSFSYTSSNTNVATISGNTLSIVGAGTSVITATQTANAGFTSGTATANLTVNAVLPTITSFTPTSGTSGTLITINGTFLSRVTSIIIGGVPASFSVINATTIQATVGANPTSGNVTVTIANDGSGSLGGFCAIVTPSLSLSVASSDLCSGTSAVNFTANPFNGGTSPSYQWKKNGIVVGTNSVTYKDPSPSSGSVITCTMTSSAACLTTNTAVATYTESLITSVTPTISISVPSTSICTGTSVTFIANITNGGLSPTFQWKKNGVNVGLNSSFYTDASLTNGSVISCVLTSNASCATSTTVTSSSLTISTTTGAIPAINIYASNVNVCNGGTVTFFSTISSVGASVSYQWYKNGIAISGANYATYATNGLNPNDAIYCVMTTSNSCSTSNTFPSNVVTPNVSNLPTSMTPTVSATSVCKGTPVSLSSGFNTNNFSVSSITYNNIPVPGNAATGPVGDDVVGGPYSLPFTFNFFGNAYNSFYISTNGNVQFGPNRNASFTPGPLPNSSVLNFAALCWSDIVVGSSWNSGSIHYFVDGIAPFRKMVIDWTNCSFYNGIGAISGQIWLYESTGVVETHLTTAYGSGLVKTTGVNNADGTIGAAAVNRNGTNWQTSTPEAWRFTPSGNYSCAWSPSETMTSSSSFTPTATPTDTTTYTMQVTDQITGCVSTGTVKVNVIPNPSIIVSPSASSICAGSPVTFTATIRNAGTSSAYQWIKNGNYVGVNSSTYTDAGLSNNDSVWCVLTTNGTCGTTATSSKIKIAVTTNIIPSVSITASNGTNNVCTGANVTFTATALNAGSTPSYQWKKGGVAIPGATTSTYNYVPTNGDVITCAVTANNTCQTTSLVNSVAITENVSSYVTPSILINATATTICVGSNVTFTATPTNGGTAPTYQWKKGGVPITGATASTYTISSLNNNDIITCNLTSNNTCQTVSTVNSSPVTILWNTTSTNTWTGNTNSNYATSGNWCTGVVPSVGSAVTIPVVTSNNYPVLASNLSTSSLTLNAGAFLSLGGNTLTLTGTTAGTGFIKGSSTSSIVVNSTSTPMLYFNPASGDSLLNTLIISGTGGAKLGNGVGITNLLSLNAGNLNLNGKSLTLKSTSIASTAVVGPVANGATITGNITVERFIPQGYKAFRQLSAGGVYNAGSIFNNWQEGGNAPVGYGTLITGNANTTPSGVNPATGLDYTTSGSSGLYVQDLVTSGTLAITNTKTTNLNPYTGYYMRIWGDRTINPYLSNFDVSNQMVNATTLRATGSLVTGTVTMDSVGVTGNYNSTAYKLIGNPNQTSLVGNPYASIVDWESLTTAGLTTSYNYIDPTYLNATGLQVLFTYNGTTHVNNNPSASKINRYVQPGQAIWVINSSTASARKLIFTESNKVTDPTKFTSVFNDAKPFNRLAISLWKDVKNVGNVNVDGTVAVFDYRFTKQFGMEDSRKVNNPQENISIIEADGERSIDGINTPMAGDVINLKLSQLSANTTYWLRIDADLFREEGLQAYLMDSYLNKQTPIGSDTTIYTFSSTGVATENINRFSISFEKINSAPSITNVVAKVSIYPNPLTNKSATVQLSDMAAGNYSIQVFNTLGKEVMIQKVKYNGGVANYPISLYVANGVYTLKISDSKGREVGQSKLIVE